MMAYNIQWDTDGESVELPDSVEVPADVDVADWLSDKYGWLVLGYELSMISVVTGTAPSHWAIALINGDWSGMTTEESIQATSFIKWLGAVPVSCEDAGFIWKHDASRFGVGGSDCQTYSALVHD